MAAWNLIRRCHCCCCRNFFFQFISCYLSNRRHFEERRRRWWWCRQQQYRQCNLYSKWSHRLMKEQRKNHEQCKWIACDTTVELNIVFPCWMLHKLKFVFIQKPEIFEFHAILMAFYYICSPRFSGNVDDYCWRDIYGKCLKNTPNFEMLRFSPLDAINGVLWLKRRELNA